ncbi:MAG TPA: response regulator [Thermoanaerobaculaceae bacterium]|nr:response regulator [Thermoanaerobaculaceae bacterium]HPS79469.1 response regulator [Thermoanaerobaculaceae bacterium]
MQARPCDILIVEDNPTDAELMVRALRHANLANPVTVVEDGAEALDYLFGRGRHVGRPNGLTPRVILLDLKLPKVSGLEVLESIRADEHLRHIPVVVVTSSREEPDIQQAYALGVNSYVVKPVEFESFAEAMAHVGLYWLLINQPPG